MAIEYGVFAKAFLLEIGSAVIDKNSETTKEYIKTLYDKTKDRNFGCSSLAFIETEDNMRKLLDYINENPNCSIADIDYMLVKIGSSGVMVGENHPHPQYLC